MIGLSIVIIGILFIGGSLSIMQYLPKWIKNKQKKKHDQKLEQEFFSQDNFDPVGRMLNEYKQTKKQKYENTESNKNDRTHHSSNVEFE